MADISVIIVSYKGAERLSSCLRSLDGFSGGKMTTEVIITDNDSQDNAIDLLKEQYCRFTFICNNVNGGFANGCNLGATAATGEYLLFLNPDTIVTEEAVGKLVEAAGENPSFTIISCKQVRENGSESIAWGAFPGMWNLTGLQRAIAGVFSSGSHIRTMPGNNDIWLPDWVSGSVILIRRDDFNAVGGFDDDYWMYYEDVDLCKKVTDRGGRVAFFRNITIEHNHGGSSRLNTKTTALTKTEVMISRHLYISKHMQGPERFSIHLFMVINNLISGLIPAIFGLVLPFVPKLFARSRLYSNLIGYYFKALVRKTWISPRSVNYNGSNIK